MQSSHMFPATQTRTGSQVQGSQGYGQPQPPVVTNYSPYGSAPQVHHVGQQVFSAPQHTPGKQFPHVVQQHSAQPFPAVQVPVPHMQQYPQPTHYGAQVVTPQPQVFGQGQGPMFPAMKDRK